MIQQEENISAPSLNEKHSAAIRLWHWSSFVVIAALLTTVLIASTLLKSQYNAPAFQDALKKSGTTITTDQAKALGRPMSHNLWTWHKYFGIVLAALFLFRIVLEFFQPADEGFFSRIKNVRRYLKLPAADSKTARHYYLVKLLYTFFYISLTVTVLTGLTLAFGDSFGISKPVEETIKDIHNFNMYVILTFIIVHFTGVVLGELGKFKGVVSNMINGGK